MRPRDILLALLPLCLLATASAIGISPSAKELPYVSGEEHILTFIAINNGDSAALFDVYFEGDLADYATAEKTQLVVKPSQAKNFNVRLTLPPELEPGPHSLQVGIIERSNLKTGMVSGRAAVKSNIEVNVPLAGKYLKARISANDANIGEPVHFAINVRNLGNETMRKVSSVVSVFKFGQKVGFVDSNSIANFAPLQSGDLVATWDSTESGGLLAVADIFYDELSSRAETKFRVGRLLVNIIDVAYDEIVAGTIGKIAVKMESKWNAKVENVFVELFVYKDGQFVTRTNGRPFTLVPWDIYIDYIYLDTKGFEPGVYEGKAAVHYGDKTAEQTFKLGIVSQRKFDNTIYVAIVVLLASMILLLLIYSRQSKRSGKKR